MSKHLAQLNAFLDDALRRGAFPVPRMPISASHHPQDSLHPAPTKFAKRDIGKPWQPKFVSHPRRIRDRSHDWTLVQEGRRGRRRSTSRLSSSRPTRSRSKFPRRRRRARRSPPRMARRSASARCSARSPPARRRCRCSRQGRRLPKASRPGAGRRSAPAPAPAPLPGSRCRSNGPAVRQDRGRERRLDRRPSPAPARMAA
jgi:hypothetical protein